MAGDEGTEYLSRSISRGQLVKQRREGLGLTQEALAANAGVTRSWLSLLELDRSRKYDREMLQRLAVAIGLPPDGLLSLVAGDVLISSSQTGNVRGFIDELRLSSERPRPIYRWGTCGDPREEHTAPDPDHLEYPPAQQARLIGPRGFGVMIRGDSMVGQGIEDGATVWVNPDAPIQTGRVVLANVVGDDGDEGMVVKLLINERGQDQLVSHTARGQEAFLYSQYKIIGRVVWISPEGHPPGERPTFNYA